MVPPGAKHRLLGPRIGHWVLGATVRKTGMREASFRVAGPQPPIFTMQCLIWV
jgi:hypothetical protein